MLKSYILKTFIFLNGKTENDIRLWQLSQDPITFLNYYINYTEGETVPFKGALLDDNLDLLVSEYELKDKDIIFVEINFNNGWTFERDIEYCNIECKEKYKVANYLQYWKQINNRPFVTTVTNDFFANEYKKIIKFANKSIVQSAESNKTSIKSDKEVFDIKPNDKADQATVQLIGTVVKINFGGLLTKYKEESLSVSTRRRYHGKPSGIQNIGNTCYLGSSVQCLKYTSLLCSYLSENNFDTNSIGEGKVITEFAKLIQALGTDGNCVTPNKFKKTIDKYTSQFPLNKQCDAHEFLLFLIDKLHDEIPSKDLEIDKLFYGKFTSAIECEGCHKSSISNEPFMCISLPIDGIIEDVPLIVQTNTQGLFSIICKIDDEGITIKDLKVKISSTLMINDLEIYLLITNNEIEKLDDNLKVGEILSLGKSWRLYGIENTISTNDDLLIKLDIGKQSSTLFLRYPREVIENEIELRSYLKSIVADPFSTKKSLESPEYNFSFMKGLIHTTQKGLSYLRIELKPLCRSSYFFDITDRLPYITISYLRYKTEPEDYGSLEGCLRCFTGVERLHGKNQWSCESCHKSNDANKKIDYLQLPKILIIHLKRFKIRCKKSRVKISKFVNFPMNLTLSKYDKQDVKYRLYGVINHVGEIERGHYTAYCKRDAWMQFDDNKVNPLNEDNVATENAYVLFYETVDP